MMHNEYHMIVPAGTCIEIVKESPVRTCLRITNVSDGQTGWIGNGSTTTNLNGYPVYNAATGRLMSELIQRLCAGEDCRQSYWCYTDTDADCTLAIMEHCCRNAEAVCPSPGK